MKDWPRLSAASLKAIELAELKAESSLRSNVKRYTPFLNPKFRRTPDNLREGGYRVIDYICGYAETLFDAFAVEYSNRAIETTVPREALLTQRVAAEVERRAWKFWGNWVIGTGITEEPRISPTLPGDIQPGDIQLDAPPKLKRQGIEKVVFHFAEKPSDPKFGPILLQLQERFRIQLQKLLQARIHQWQGRGTEKSADVSSHRLNTGRVQAVSPETEALQRSRARLLADYKAATGTSSNRMIYESANSGIHKPQFYEWRDGKLPNTSATTINFERFLRDKRPPKKPES